MSHDDLDFEPIPGLPAVPPDGEHILWRGSPHWPTLARRALHVDKIALYFALLIVWRMSNQWYDDQSSAAALASAAAPLAAGGIAISLLTLIAWGIARSTIYTVTSRRVVMRFGVALPITFNLPFASIASVSLRKFANNAGDLPIHLSAEKRLPYLVLWPHVRPWHVNSPQPMLRCVHDAPRVAGVLSMALASHASISAGLAGTSSVFEDIPGASDAIGPTSPRLVAAE